MKSRFISMLLCICLVVSLMAGFAVTASADDDVINYTVENGDYLFKICRNIGIDYYQCKNAIMILNGFTSEAQLNRISVGQIIKLPASNSVAATVKASSATTTTTRTITVGGKTTTVTSTSTVSGTAAGYNVAFFLVPYTVKNGDTLNGICNALGSNYATYGSMILAMNGINSANNVQAGKNVLIPTTQAPTGTSNYYAVVSHTVASGENMTTICSSYGLNYASNSTLINGLNNSSNLNKIQAGQKVYIPLKSAAISGSSTSTTPAVPAAAASNSGYNITFNSPENGAPYAAINNVRITRADAGKTVYIIPNANSDYSVKSMQVTRLDTNANVIITENHFVMPQSDVKVTVLYSEAKKITKSVSPADSGTVDVQMNGESVSYALYGDKVTVVVAPKAGYTVNSVTFEKASDPMTWGKATKVSSDAYTFTMPNYNTKVVVVYEKAILYTLKSEIDPAGNGSGSLSYKLNNIAIKQASRGNKIDVYVTPDTDCAIAELDDGGLVVKTNMLSSIKVTKVEKNHYTFEMPASDAECEGITITAKFFKSVKYAISKSGVTGGSIYFTDVDGNKITSALPDEKVYIVRVANSGYVYDETTYPDDCKTTVLYANGNVMVPVYQVVGENDFFYMPQSAVNVKVTFYKTGDKRFNINKNSPQYGKYTVTVDETGSGVYNAMNTAAKNATVKVELEPNVGYRLKQITVTAADNTVLLNNSSGLTHYFTMPEKSVTIKVVYEKNDTYQTFYLVTDPAEGGTVKATIDGKTIVDGQQIRVGSNIVLAVTPNSGYTIDTVTCDLEADPLKAAEAGKYKYALADEADPTFTVTFKPVEYELQYSYPTNGTYVISVDGTDYSKTCTAHAGQTIVIKSVTPNTNYEISTVAVDDISVMNYIEADGQYEFVMPSANVKTVASFKKSESAITKYAINYIGSEGACSAPAEAAQDESVTITLVIPEGKTTIDSVTVDGTDMTAELVGTSVKFVMPANAVDIDASFS